MFLDLLQLNGIMLNVRIFGKCSSMLIVEHISALFTKNQYIVRNHRKTRDELYVSTVKYTSDHGGKKERMMFMSKYI